MKLFKILTIFCLITFFSVSSVFADALGGIKNGVSTVYTGAKTRLKNSYNSASSSLNKGYSSANSGLNKSYKSLKKINLKGRLGNFNKYSREKVRGLKSSIPQKKSFFNKFMVRMNGTSNMPKLGSAEFRAQIKDELTANTSLIDKNSVIGGMTHGATERGFDFMIHGSK